MSTKATRKPKAIDIKEFLAEANGGRSRAEYRANDPIFVQGYAANEVFYIRQGKVKLTVLSKQGKEAVVALLKEGDFFGEGCLAGQHMRMATAVAL